MAFRQTEFAHNEWYHCYTRSIDKRTVFETSRDYERFLQALYVCNGTRTTQRSTLYKPSHDRFFTLPRGHPLVAIGSYCLMPNHFHLLMREIRDAGISTFMQKLGTSFSMYFNVSRAHVGNVFIKPFRSKHIDDDRYLKQVAQYIHLNPIELFEHAWKLGRVKNMRTIERKLREYRYSSLPDYCGVKRVENAILDVEAVDMFNELPILRDILIEAAEYYADLDM